MKKLTDWIVVKYDVQPAIQLCTRCGTHDNFPFNQPIGYVSDVLKAFIKAHRNCKEKNNDSFTTTKKN